MRVRADRHRRRAAHLPGQLQNRDTSPDLQRRERVAQVIGLVSSPAATPATPSAGLMALSSATLEVSLRADDVAQDSARLSERIWACKERWRS
jgi:hypothetical protein